MQQLHVQLRYVLVLMHHLKQMKHVLPIKLDVLQQVKDVLQHYPHVHHIKVIQQVVMDILVQMENVKEEIQ